MQSSEGPNRKIFKNWMMTKAAQNLWAGHIPSEGPVFETPELKFDQINKQTVTCKMRKREISLS
jgi:hypothetical protein